MAQGSVCESGNRKRANGLFVPHEGSQRVFRGLRRVGVCEASSPRKPRGIDASAFLAAHAIGRHHRSLGCVPRSRTLGPPRFSSMNSTPAVSSTRRMAYPGEFGLAGGELGATDRRRRTHRRERRRTRRPVAKESGSRSKTQSPVWNAKGPLAREACAGYLTCVLLYDASTRLWRLPKN